MPENISIQEQRMHSRMIDKAQLAELERLASDAEQPSLSKVAKAALTEIRRLNAEVGRLEQERYGRLLPAQPRPGSKGPAR